jgi:putative ABC transport system substrate-binding protein
MRRREFITLLGATTASRPVAARAQKQISGIARIGVLSPFSRTTGLSAFVAFAETLRDLGWIEGTNLAFEYRWADGQADRLPGLAAELVRLKVDVIFDTYGTPAALAAKHATTTIPVIFAGTGDAVGVGLVASLARPGGNITGVSNLTEQTIGKQLEFLKEILPSLARVTVVINPTNPVYGPLLKASEAPARALNLQLLTIGIRDSGEVESAFDAAVKQGAEGFVVLRDTVLIMSRSELAALAAKYRRPAVYAMREFAEVSGLLSFGPDFADMYRRCAHIIEKILKGAQPSDVPVEQTTRFQLVINMKTAKALGLSVPPSLLARADEVIE